MEKRSIFSHCSFLAPEITWIHIIQLFRTQVLVIQSWLAGSWRHFLNKIASPNLGLPKTQTPPCKKLPVFLSSHLLLGKSRCISSFSISLVKPSAIALLLPPERRFWPTSVVAQTVHPWVGPRSSFQLVMSNCLGTLAKHLQVKLIEFTSIYPPNPLPMVLNLIASNPSLVIPPGGSVVWSHPPLQGSLWRPSRSNWSQACQVTAHRAWSSLHFKPGRWWCGVKKKKRSWASQVLTVDKASLHKACAASIFAYMSLSSALHYKPGSTTQMS